MAHYTETSGKRLLAPPSDDHRPPDEKGDQDPLLYDSETLLQGHRFLLKLFYTIIGHAGQGYGTSIKQGLKAGASTSHPAPPCPCKRVEMRPHTPLRLSLLYVLAALVLCTLADSRLGAKCKRPSVRKEWRTLSTKERTNWIDAVKVVEVPTRAQRFRFNSCDSVWRNSHTIKH